MSGQSDTQVNIVSPVVGHCETDNASNAHAFMIGSLALKNRKVYIYNQYELSSAIAKHKNDGQSTQKIQKNPFFN